MRERMARRRIAGTTLATLALSAALSVTTGGVSAGATGRAHAGLAHAGAVALDSTPSWPPATTIDDVVPVIPSNVSVSDAAGWVENALSVRASELTTLKQQVDSNKGLPTALQSELDTLLASDLSGIQSLQATVANSGDLATLQSAIDAMIDNYRVFSLVQPEVTDLLEAETQLGAAHKLGALETSLEAAIAADRSTKAGSQLATLKTDYERLLTKVDSEDNAIVTNLVSISPTAFSTALGALSSVKTALQGAASDLTSARQELRAILKDLANPNAVNGVARVSILRLKRRAGFR